MKRKLWIDIHISNMHYRLKSLGELRDVINEKILEVDMSFLKKAGVRGIVIDENGVWGRKIKNVKGHIKVVVIVGISKREGMVIWCLTGSAYSDEIRMVLGGRDFVEKVLKES